MVNSYPPLFLFIASYTSIKPLRTSLPEERVTNLIQILREIKGGRQKKKSEWRREKNMSLWNTLVGEKPFAPPSAQWQSLHFLYSN